jgi:hypothetical protein
MAGPRKDRPEEDDSDDLTPPPQAAPSSSPLGSIAWAIAAVLLAMILVGGVVAYKVVTLPHEIAKETKDLSTAVADRLEGMAGKVFDKIGGGLRPLVTIRSSVTSQFTRIDSTPKLVVLTDTLSVEVVRSSEKSVLWGQLNLGKTEVRLRAPDNKVQFYIPLTALKAEDFSYDAARSKIVIRVPEPVLDRDVVDVQSDPAKIEVETKVGWARLSAYSGKSMEAEARQSLRDEVLKSADTQAWHETARMNADKHLRTLFSDLLDSVRPDVRVEFQFVPTPTSAATPTKTGG